VLAKRVANISNINNNNNNNKLHRRQRFFASLFLSSFFLFERNATQTHVVRASQSKIHCADERNLDEKPTRHLVGPNIAVS